MMFAAKTLAVEDARQFDTYEDGMLGCQPAKTIACSIC